MNALLRLGLGAFAVGTEGFVIAPLLPTIARDLGVPVATAAYAVPAFAVTYALASPLLAALTGGIDRRRLLLWAIAAFAAANLVAATAMTFPHLLIARMLLALSAGLFMPVANATAVQLVPPSQRGRAVAVVTGGVTIAVALGAPLGAWLGHATDWRTTFLAIGLAAAVAFIGIARQIPRGLSAPATTLGERLSAMRRGDILILLATTVVWSAGGFAVYTFIAPYLGETLAFGPEAVDATVFLFGVAAAGGIALGGWATDRIGAPATVRAALTAMLAAFLLLGVSGELLSGPLAMAGVLAAVGVWGVAGWAFNPPQALRLIERAPALAPVTLSLNASALHLGSGLGALTGAAAVAQGGVVHLPWLGALGMALALATLIRRPQPAPRAEPGRA
jgi:predicted MFS family arabinose efflux permease